MDIYSLLIILGVTAIFAALLFACVMRDLLQEANNSDPSED